MSPHAISRKRTHFFLLQLYQQENLLEASGNLSSCCIDPSRSDVHRATAERVGTNGEGLEIRVVFTGRSRDGLGVVGPAWVSHMDAHLRPPTPMRLVPYPFWWHTEQRPHETRPPTRGSTHALPTRPRRTCARRHAGASLSQPDGSDVGTYRESPRQTQGREQRRLSWAAAPGLLRG